MAIIEQFATTTSDWQMRRAILDAVLQMPPELSARLIPKIEQEAWHESPSGEWLSNQFEEFLTQLITGGAHEYAQSLARILLSTNESRHHYGEYLKQFSAVPPAALLPYLEL